MIHLGHSLLHLLDTESARRGLTRADMVECFKLAITENFRRRGKIVVVTVDDTEGQAVISAVETVLTGGPQAMYREMHFIPPFTPEMLAESIEGYVASRLEASPWFLVETTVVQREADHYLLEVAHSPFGASAADAHTRHEGQLAVLPRKSVAQRDGFKIGEAIWVVVKANVRTSIDGGYAEAWRNVQAPLVASRTESEFLARMAYQLLNEPVQAMIHTDRGILIFPQGKDLAPLLGDNCRYKNMLQRLTGLERLAVARQTNAPVAHKRLIHAIREVAGLKYQVDYKLGCADPAKLPVIYTRPESVKRLVGVGGHNLFFIKCVCGFQFEIKAGKSAPVDLQDMGGDGVVEVMPVHVAGAASARIGAPRAA